jgi:two-component system, cell cycle sensor histidine kinase and response regulator CckA
MSTLTKSSVWSKVHAVMSAENPVATILVVDDEPSVRKLVVGILRAARYRVLQASSGEEGLEVHGAHRGQVDLVVSDVMMAGITGPDMIDRLRKKGEKVPVLFISGHPTSALAQAGLGKAETFLAKPFSPSQLKAVVAALLERL